jgi:hemoglobin-like flavoprotein
MGQQQFVTENGEPITQEQYQQILAAQQNQMGYEDGIGQENDGGEVTKAVGSSFFQEKPKTSTTYNKTQEKRKEIYKYI